MKIKNTIILLGILLVLAIIFIFFGVLNSSKRVETQNNQAGPTPYRTPAIFRNSPDAKSESNESASPLDLKREKLIEMADKTGRIHKEDSFSVSYDEKSQVFNIELLAPDTTKAKGDSVQWMALEGIDENEVCKLPIFFYIDESAKQQLPRYFDIDQNVPGC